MERGVLFCTYSLLTGGSVATSKLKASLPRFERSMLAVEVETVKGIAEFGACLACRLARSGRANSLHVLHSMAVQRTGRAISSASLYSAKAPKRGSLCRC